MHDDCTIYSVADLIGKKWTIILILEIYKGNSSSKRYSEIKKHLPQITPKMLSARLKELEKEGFIEKKVDFSSMPVKCEYSLTRIGLEFISVLMHMKKWALKWKPAGEHCIHSRCKGCGL
jgi:DNA-binding HxlR family transcriptional regulator